MIEEKMLLIEIEDIDLNPFQPRTLFTDDEIRDLAKSIQTVGLIHPPTVRENERGKYELLSGERRLRASRLAGLKQIPVYVKNCSNRLSAEAALIENIQRVDLNPLEIAHALKKLMDDYSLNQEELSNRIGKKRSTVANYLRLLTLPLEIQQSVRSDLITMGHAKAILSLDKLNDQLTLHDWILRHHLSVRAAEEAVKKITGTNTKAGNQENPFLHDIRRRLEERFHVKAHVKEEGGKGLVALDFFNLDDLERLMEIMGA